METKSKSTFTTTDKEIIVSRLLDAPIDLVFEMWTNPEHIKHWWGPKGFTNTIYKMDVTEGGEWDFTMHGPNGADFRNTNRFVKIIKNEKIVLEHTGPPFFQLIATFKEEGDKTLLNVKSVFESAELLQKVVKEVNAAEGLKQNIDKLEVYITTVPKEKELVIMRQFNAPRELMFKVWSQAEHLAKWWGPKGANIKVNRFEFKPGGTFLYSMMAPTGSEMWGKFVYREITAPEKLVFVNSFSDKDGNTVPNPWMPVWPLEILNTLTLIEHEGKTTLTIKGKPIHAKPEEIKNFEAHFDSMQGGFSGTFDTLNEYLMILKK
jgi:uncharacterized protein YndB with AHSA1/START domain